MLFVDGQIDVTPAGAVLHKGDLAAQTQVALDNIETVLGARGANLEDVVKLVMFYENRGNVDEHAALEALASRFPGAVPPAVTPVPLPDLAYPNMVVEIEAIAMRRSNGAHMARTAANPEGHWDWDWDWDFSHAVRCGEMIFVGGQVCQDHKGKVIHSGDIVRQTFVTMENICRVLACYGLGMNDLVKVNTFYKGGASYEKLHQNLSVRSECFRDPGTTTTGISFIDLGIEGLEIEVEGAAMTE
jgi:enamine deaminase RidA (YjgF/YER057c/UK114 family)